MYRKIVMYIYLRIIAYIEYALLYLISLNVVSFNYMYLPMFLFVFFFETA